MSGTVMTERLRERRYRLMMRLPVLWQYAWNFGTWEVVEVSHYNDEGQVIES